MHQYNFGLDLALPFYRSSQFIRMKFAQTMSLQVRNNLQTYLFIFIQEPLRNPQLSSILSRKGNSVGNLHVIIRARP